MMPSLGLMDGSGGVIYTLGKMEVQFLMLIFHKKEDDRVSYLFRAKEIIGINEVHQSISLQKY